MKELTEMNLQEKLTLFREIWDNISYDAISSALGDLSDVDFSKLDAIIKGIEKGENCSQCGNELTGEDFITQRENEEFWGAPCHYDITVGYECTCCGYHEVY